MRLIHGWNMSANSLSELCIVVFAAGWYRTFVPLFLFSLFQAYKYDVVIFLDSPPDDAMLRGIEIATHSGGRYELVCDERLREYPHPLGRKARVEIYQAMRFLVFTSGNVKRFFSKYKYVYTTDVDILIMPERPSLLKQHVKHCKVLGLPYSNFIRAGTKRLTGLHFMKVDEYFPPVSPVVDKYVSLVREKGLHDVVGAGRGHDERLLYCIVEDAVLGFPNCSCQAVGDTLNPQYYHQVCFGPHHGIHFGTGRNIGRFAHIIQSRIYAHYLHELQLLARGEPRFMRLYAGLDNRARWSLKAIFKDRGLRLC